MPNCALAAIHIRQKNERDAREREIKAERERRAQEGESTFKVILIRGRSFMTSATLGGGGSVKI